MVEFQIVDTHLGRAVRFFTSRTIADRECYKMNSACGFDRYRVEPIHAAVQAH